LVTDSYCNMATSQPIELKLGQALRIFAHLGWIEIGKLADELEIEHNPKFGSGQKGYKCLPEVGICRITT
jgi:hypothetical protein